MLHLILHGLVPLIVAWLLYRKEWRLVFFILIGTMLVDVDHLLADPIYDPNRCSIGFHPLHTWPAMVVYGGMMVVPLLISRFRGNDEERVRSLWIVHVVGLGLLIHMVLDWSDCLF